MVKIKIKPLSTNKAWKGKRFKSAEYKKFDRDVSLLLPAHYPIPEGNLHIKIEVGFSNTLSDLDNAMKQLLDIISRAYEFNDNRVFKITMTKRIVKKSEEYIAFSIESAIE
jgi:Holliday junction resolvase RusA-like endonuclease